MSLCSLLMLPIRLPLRALRWCVLMAGVWWACIVGIILSCYGYVCTKRRTPRTPRSVQPLPGVEHSSVSQAPLIAVVIPCKNEGPSVRETVLHTVGTAETPQRLEIVIVDAQSTDNTATVAAAVCQELESAQRVSSARLRSSACGRGGSLNAGASTATAPILIFLHADTLLPRGWDTDVRQAVARPSVVAGSFTFGVNRKSFNTSVPLGIGTMEVFANFRSKHFMLPYGDQAMFMTRARFEEAGCFPDQRMMEDFELTRNLRRRAIAEGGEYVMVPKVALCSGRRWEVNGVLLNTLLNQVFVFAYTSLNYTADDIYKLYYGRRK